MENIIEKLTEIEAVASKTMESVAGRKQELMKEMADRRRAFDVQVEDESHIYLENLQKQLTIQKEEELKELRKNTEQQVQQNCKYCQCDNGKYVERHLTDSQADQLIYHQCYAVSHQVLEQDSEPEELTVAHLLRHGGDSCQTR